MNWGLFGTKWGFDQSDGAASYASDSPDWSSSSGPLFAENNISATLVGTNKIF